MLKKIVSLFLSLNFILAQSGFAQGVAELNMGNYLAQMGSQPMNSERFRPAHLRYFSYDPATDNLQLLLDKGDNPEIKDKELQDKTKMLMEYFQIGLALPNDKFWVNLRPDAQEEIIDPELEKTDLGKVMLEADLQLKRDTASFTSPQTPEGRQYWDKLYKKAGELFGTENITIPTITRPWIVPGEIILRQGEDSAYIFKANMKVMLEHDHLKGSAVYDFKDPRMKELNEYSSQLIRELIIPKLTKEVNTSKRYAALRQVFFSLVMARWFKDTFSGKPGQYAQLIDSHNLNNLTSKESWSKTYYFNEYKKSFEQGEYNLKENLNTPSGQVIRSYVSGGIMMDFVRNAYNNVSKKALLSVLLAGASFFLPATGNAKVYSLGDYSINEHGSLTRKEVMEFRYAGIEEGLINRDFTHDFIKEVLFLQGLKEYSVSLDEGKLKIVISANTPNSHSVKINYLSGNSYIIKYGRSGASENVEIETSNKNVDPQIMHVDIFDALDALRDELDSKDFFEERIKFHLLRQGITFAAVGSYFKQSVPYVIVPLTDEELSPHSISTDIVPSERKGTGINRIVMTKVSNDSYKISIFLAGGIQYAREGSPAYDFVLNKNGSTEIGTSFSPDTTELEKPYMVNKMSEILKATIAGTTQAVTTVDNKVIVNNAQKEEPFSEKVASRLKKDGLTYKNLKEYFGKTVYFNVAGESFQLDVAGSFYRGGPAASVAIYFPGATPLNVGYLTVSEDDIFETSEKFYAELTEWHAKYPGREDMGKWNTNYLEQRGISPYEFTNAIMAALKKQGSSPLENAQKVISSPLKPGGIDFRSMQMLIQPMGSFSNLNLSLPTLSLSALERIDLDKELAALRNMVKAGMVPSGARVKEYLAAVFQKGMMEEKQDDLLLCLAEIYRLQEEEVLETSPELRESLVIVDTGKFVLLPQ